MVREHRFVLFAARPRFDLSHASSGQIHFSQMQQANAEKPVMAKKMGYGHTQALSATDAGVAHAQAAADRARFGNLCPRVGSSAGKAETTFVMANRRALRGGPTGRSHEPPRVGRRR
jgi:hypothetical protein